MYGSTLETKNVGSDHSTDWVYRCTFISVDHALAQVSLSL